MTARHNSIRILIILMGSLGDVARALALVRPLKQAFPSCEITWLVEPACKDLVALHPEIDQILVFERARWLGAAVKVIRTARTQRFDLVLDLQRHLKSGLFSRLCAGARRIGFHPRDSKECNWLFQTEYIDEAGESAAKLEHYFLFLKKLGISIPAKPDFGLADSVRATLSALPKELSAAYCVFVLGSRWRTKDWPISGYLELAKQVIERSTLSVVMVGGLEAGVHAEELERALGSNRIVNCVGKTTIAELARIMQDARVVVGPDSGPGHLAAALGVAYISLFGPTAPRRTAPYASEHLVVKADVACAPCYRRTCPGLGTLCMRLISPDAVLKKMEPFLDASTSLHG